MGPDRRLLNAGIVCGSPRLAQGDWEDRGDQAACASPAPWVPEGCWAPPAARQSRDGAPQGESSAKERAWPSALLLSNPFLGCLPRHVEEVRRWTGSRAGPVALGIRAGLARVKRGRAGFQSVPPPPALGRSLVPSSFPPVHPNQVLPGSPRRAPARVRDTRWQCHTGAAAHTARLGGSGVLWCLSPVLPQLAVAFTALGLFWVPQNQALRLTEDTSSANNGWVSWRAAGFSCWFCEM